MNSLQLQRAESCGPYLGSAGPLTERRARAGVLTATVPLCALQGEVCSLAFSPEWLRARRIAFAMALHERLGAASVARVLSLEPLMLVLEFMVA